MKSYTKPTINQLWPLLPISPSSPPLFLIHTLRLLPHSCICILNGSCPVCPLQRSQSDVFEIQIQNVHSLLNILWWLLTVLQIKRKIYSCPRCSAMVWPQPLSHLISSSPSLPLCHRFAALRPLWLPCSFLLQDFYKIIIQRTNSSAPSSRSKLVCILQFNNHFLKKGSRSHLLTSPPFYNLMVLSCNFIFFCVSNWINFLLDTI